MNKFAKALVVDDEALIRTIILKLLEQKGIKGVEAGNGNVAITELKLTQEFDVIFLDLLMPSMSGWEVLEWIKDNPKTADIPVVLMTGIRLSSEEETKLYDRGVSILHKGTMSLQAFNTLLTSLLEIHGD